MKAPHEITVFVSRLATMGDKQLLIIPKDKHVGKQMLGRQVKVTVELV